ncbi:amino acid ABC transporter substrate-binding protein [Propylenella binzhouense]|uniref:Branched-chain amino acid ABC transporter substrate-binding protein n=1 Tax=Propylenella binzhouense TaxID=2555902 RepID=A0A964T2K0_9HYPH|nr:amino acid ABC transporter substrate-binding protein [Propylenella binzhouense]MYZ46772.1 branched-chain amino acid ABC transporter substrate-binding protein [Propylenella binzhouense]
MHHMKSAMIAAAGLALLAPPAFSQGVIKIGSSLPLTGGFAVTGDKHRQGFQLCVDMINDKGGLLGKKVELVVSDNRSDTETALSQYERLINVDKVDVLFGTFSSKLTFPTSAVAHKYGMVYPVPSGGALRIWTQGFDNMFYFQQNAAELFGDAPVKLIQERVPEGERPKTVAIVHSDDFFANAIAAGLLGRKVENPGGGVVADLAPGYLKEAGLEVVMEERWPEEGFSDWLNLANSIKRADADLVIGLTASAEEAVQLTRALQTVRAEPKMLYLSQGTQNEYKEGLGKAANGVIVHTSWHADAPWEGAIAGEKITNQAFQQAFKAKFGSDADEDSAIPFAVCEGVEQAIRGAGTTDNAKLKEWLHARTKEDPVRTVLGPFSWDDRGLPVDRTVLLAQWQDGALKFVYPTDEFAGVSDLVYPKPAW